MLNTGLEKYLRAFAKLKRGSTKYGPAPHKLVFLISLIELVDNYVVTNNQFEVNAELVATFKENWLLLVPTMHQPDFTQPFYYLQSDKVDKSSFWMLKPNFGMQINAHIKSVAKLSEVCAFGYFDEELTLLLHNQVNRNIFINFLLDNYFAEEKSKYFLAKNSGNGYLKDQEDYVLNEPQVHQTRIIAYAEEDVFVRNGFFKKQVPQVYRGKCSFTGMQLSNTFGYSFVDACHIVPFSQTQNDKVTNGIALCPNLHRAFDRGLVSISMEHTILVSDHLIENEKNDYSLKRLAGRKILLPTKEIHFPDQTALAWHRTNIFKA